MIKVIQGPDKGSVFEIPRHTVRIGIGISVDVRLTDPQLRGRLVVEWKSGTYHVRNDLEFAIYLDNEILGRGESRVWFDDVVLQPTAQTQLVLQNRDPDTNELPGQPSVTPGQQKHRSNGVNLFILIVAALGISFGFLVLSAPVEKQVRMSMNGRQLISKSTEVMEKLEGSLPWAQKNGLGVKWTQMSESFQHARLADRQGNFKLALERYQDCSNQLHVIRAKISYDSKELFDDAAKLKAIDALESLGMILNAKLIEKHR